MQIKVLYEDKSVTGKGYSNKTEAVLAAFDYWIENANDMGDIISDEQINSMKKWDVYELEKFLKDKGFEFRNYTYQPLHETVKKVLDGKSIREVMLEAQPVYGPGKVEYKRVDVRTEKGIRQAEKLKAEGWIVGSVGFDTIEFYRKKKHEGSSVKEDNLIAKILEADAEDLPDLMHKLIGKKVKDSDGDTWTVSGVANTHEATVDLRGVDTNNTREDVWVGDLSLV